MPHGQNIERTAEPQSGRLLGSPEAEEQDVGNTFVPFPLEMVLGQPEDVIAERLHVLGQVVCDGKGASTALIDVPAVIGWDAVEADPFTFQDMARIQDGNIRERRVTSIGDDSIGQI
jgi:hypothetical protein